MSGGTAVATAVSTERLAFARVMFESLRRWHPDVPCFAVVVDGAGGATREPSFTTLSVDDLNIPACRQWSFGYGRDLVVIAVKPHLLAHVLERGYDRVVFLDTDMLVLEPLTGLLHPHDHSAITLTPHFATPLATRTPDEELRVLRSGVFNGGCLAVGGQPAGRRFLAWWQQRLQRHCRLDVASGMQHDQRWLDLVPSMFEGVAVETDPGINVAYWNFDERRPHAADGRWMVAGGVCRLVHFSGFDPAQPAFVTRHRPELAMEELGTFAAVFEDYATRLAAAGHGRQEPGTDPYARFDNGVPVPTLAREVYLDLGDAADSFGDPFATEGPNSFFSWLRSPACTSGASGPHVTRLWDAAYRRRPDVQHAYPDPRGADRDAFLRWIVESGMREHALQDWPPAA